MSDLTAQTLRRGAGFLALILLIMLSLVAFPRPAQAAVSYSTEEIAVVQMINEYRAANGLSSLLVSDLLSDAADKHSRDMGKYGFFSHNTEASDWFTAGSTAGQRMVACGYPANHAMGENIAGGQETATSVFTSWKQSYGHNLNMLDTRWKVIGVAFVTVPGSPWTTYWATDFGDYVDATAHENGGTLPADTTSPTVSIQEPAQGAEVRGSVSVCVTAADDRAVDRVELYVNGSFVASDAASPYAVVWASSAAGNGPVTLEVRAIDKAGNVGTATRSVLVTGSTVSTTTTTTTTATPTTTTTSTTTTTPASTTSTTTPTVRTTTTTTTTATTTQPVTSFSDVPRSYVFYAPIMAMANAGIVSGYEDGFFRPNSSVTRAQFAKIITLALGEHTTAIDNAGDPTFKDVPYTGRAYPFDYIEEASALRVIGGYSNGTFAPSAKVTRLQLAMMLVRAGGEGLANPPSGYSCPFGDVPGYGRNAVVIALFNGILSGKTARTFDPYAPATRGQVAKTVYALSRILHKL